MSAAALIRPMIVKIAAGSSESSSQPANAGPTMYPPERAKPNQPKPCATESGIRSAMYANVTGP